MSTRPAHGCQKSNGCIHDGIKASGTTIPERTVTDPFRRLTPREVRTAVTKMFVRTVIAAERHTARNIEKANRHAAETVGGMRQRHAEGPVARSTSAASASMGRARSRGVAVRQAMARANQ